MLNQDEASKVTERREAEHGIWQRISLFWLIVGGLLVFVGVESILFTANIWTKTDVEYADDAVLILIGAILVWEAIR